MRIALDVMGGDHAPKEIIKGAIAASKEFDLEIVLVGDRLAIEGVLSSLPKNYNISVVHASQVIEMEETPVSAVKNKKDSSINIGLQLLKKKEVDAFVSAGNTGAVMSSSVFNLGRIKGIERPAIAVVWPTLKHHVVFLDAGANAECKPKHLYQFAHLGSIFAEQVLHLSRPRVGLLSIGEEDEKGNNLVFETRSLLKKSKLNFIGNVESKDIFKGDIDVFVCDGFVGNIILKFAEGLISLFQGLFKDEFKRSFLTKIGALFMLPTLASLQKRTNYDEYGGALLLGVKGVCVIAHGRSKSNAIKNAIRVAKESIEANIINKFSQI